MSIVWRERGGVFSIGYGLHPQGGVVYPIMEIEMRGKDENGDWALAMEFKYSNRDQVYTRPRDL